MLDEWEAHSYTIICSLQSLAAHRKSWMRREMHVRRMFFNENFVCFFPQVHDFRNILQHHLTVLFLILVPSTYVYQIQHEICATYAFEDNVLLFSGPTWQLGLLLLLKNFMSCGNVNSIRERINVDISGISVIEMLFDPPLVLCPLDVILVVCRTTNLSRGGHYSN